MYKYLAATVITCSFAACVSKNADTVSLNNSDTPVAATTSLAGPTTTTTTTTLRAHAEKKKTEEQKTDVKEKENMH